MASNKMLIDASHPEETRVVVLRGNRIEEFDFESQNKQQLKGNIYLAKVTRVEPSLQAAFVDYGGNRHGFLAFSEIHPDYYQIPVADRQALLDEEAADALLDRAQDDLEIEQSTRSTQNDVSDGADQDGESDEATGEPRPKRRQRRSRRKSNTQKASDGPSLSEASSEVGETSENSGAEEAIASLEHTSESDLPAVAEIGKDAVNKVSTQDVDTPGSDTEIIADDELQAKELTAAASEENSPVDGDAGSSTTEEKNIAASDDQDTKPGTIAAMMETESISEPAPDEETSDENSSDEGTSDEISGSSELDEPPKAKKATAKKPRRASRRPRRKTRDETTDDNAQGTQEIAASDGDDAVVSPQTEQPVSQASNLDENVEVAAPDALEQNDEGKSASNNDDEAIAVKPKPRKRRRSSRGQKNSSNDETTSASSENEGSKVGSKGNRNLNGNDDANEDNGNGSDDVESSGQEDALEEVPPRRRPRRQYKIQEVVKRRQVLLVQVVKEERGNKGAALTTYLSLAGRYSVLMPNTARGGGISRKITNAVDRKRLKTIATELDVPQGMGVILRTAGASRTKAEIQRDFEYLMRLWESVRNLTLSSSAPCLVYQEGSLIKRSIRDLYDKNTGEVLVAGEAGHNEAQEFMAMLMPSHAKKVKLYRDEQAMLARFGVEQQLEKMLSRQVTLKSGGYLVIDQTEALVSIDVNSGRSTREHSIEDTALQTNLETAEEVARQLRLRDLAGLIVIDFIDMEEKRNNRAVEKKLKECLKHDRARIQVGRISHFGLLEMSRQRMRASVLDSTMDVCPICQGKGHVRSNSTVSLHILRAIEEHLLKNSRFDLVVKAASGVALYILNHKRPALMEIEERFGVKIFIEENRDLLGENFTLEKGEPSTGERKPVTHIQAGQLAEEIIEYDSQPQTDDFEPVKQNKNAEETPGKRRRRRRSKEDVISDTQEASSDGGEGVSEAASGEADSDIGNEPGKRKRQRGKRAGRNKQKDTTDVENITENPQSSQEPAVASSAESEQTAIDSQKDEVSKPPSRNRRPRKAKSNVEPAPDSDEQNIDQTGALEEANSQIAVEAKSDNLQDQAATASGERTRSKRRTTRRMPAAPLPATPLPAAPLPAAPLVAPEPTISHPTDENEEILEAGEINDPNILQKDETSVQAASADNSVEDSTKQGGWWSRNGFFK